MSVQIIRDSVNKNLEKLHARHTDENGVVSPAAAVEVRQNHACEVLDKFRKENAELIDALKTLPKEKLEIYFCPEVAFAFILKSQGL
jgi:hypothetical protein